MTTGPKIGAFTWAEGTAPERRTGERRTADRRGDEGIGYARGIAEIAISQGISEESFLENIIAPKKWLAQKAYREVKNARLSK